MNLTDMDYIRGAIASAMVEEMTIEDLWACVEHAETATDFDEAVNILAQTMPQASDEASV